MSVILEVITAGEAIQRIHGPGGRALTSSHELESAVEQASLRMLIRFENAEAFLSLIWHSIDEARLLTPVGRPRTLQVVAERFIGMDLSFDGLVEGTVAGEYSPSWFKCCQRIDDEFDYGHFGAPLLCHPTCGERKESPSGSLYIHDGTHRALVLAIRLLRGVLDYEPVHAVFVSPRPIRD